MCTLLTELTLQGSFLCVVQAAKQRITGSGNRTAYRACAEAALQCFLTLQTRSTEVTQSIDATGQFIF